MKIRLMRWMTLLILLAGTVTFYPSGLFLGVMALLVIGMLLEFTFWRKLLFGDRQQR